MNIPSNFGIAYTSLEDFPWSLLPDNFQNYNINAKRRIYLTQILKRWVFINIFKVNPDAIHIQNEFLGKPYIDGVINSWHFNFSDCDQWLAIIWGRHPVGIDILTLDIHFDGNEPASHIAMKEAYSKMLGIGLNFDWEDIQCVENCDGTYSVFWRNKLAQGIHLSFQYFNDILIAFTVQNSSETLNSENFIIHLQNFNWKNAFKKNPKLIEA